MNKENTLFPNPQFERKDWKSLDGTWDFGYKKISKGFRFSKNEQLALSILKAAEYSCTINVPFCIESKLSGIAHTDFVNLVWYRRIVNIKAGENRVFIHIGAADFLTTVLVNGKPAGRHSGGYTSFQFDITDLTVDGENEIFILCEDNVKDPLVMRGKQSEKRDSHGCEYTRTTGIWQSVWLEYRPKDHIKEIKLFPDIKDCSVTILADFEGKAEFSCVASYKGKIVGKVAPQKSAAKKFFKLDLSEKHLWEPGKGELYDLELCFGDDKVKSYFGLRQVRLDGFKFLINEKSVFQRLVLDQGFYKDGIYTAPSEQDLVNDIEISMELGFNGARLHQKVFDPRFLYHCDKLGYLIWGEYPNWGLDYSNPKAVPIFLQEWGEAIERDFNHPALIGWCPFNETWDYHRRKQFDPLLSTVYDFTKVFDPTRPCIDTSGNYHVKTDIYDLHDYNSDPVSFKANYDRFVTENTLYDAVLNWAPGRQKYGGQAVFMSEYGGIKWESDSNLHSWGYGNDVKSFEEFLERYEGLTKALIGNERFFGFCYTQLYDVEQEQNGLYTYKREKKFPKEIYDRIKKVNSSPAKIEE